MRIEASTTYPGELGRVREVLVSEELAHKRAEAAKASSPIHHLEGNTATTTIEIPLDKVPDMARPFLKGTKQVTVTQVWEETQGDIARAQFSIDTGSLPVTVSLTQTLTGAGETTQCSFQGDLKVKIPLFGSKIEKLVASKIQGVLKRDTKLVAGLL